MMRKWIDLIEGAQSSPVLYHGTDHDFTSFAKRRKHTNFPHAGILQLGYSFTTDLEYAKQFGSKVLRVRLHMKNPFHAPIGRAYELETVSPRGVRKWKARLKSVGYDGVIFGEGSEVAEYIPFDADDIEILGEV
jgi:hypothetical protein